VAVPLGPFRAVFEQKTCEAGIAAEHGLVERGRIPIAAAHLDRPAEADHQLDDVIGACRGHVGQQSQLPWCQRGRQIGPPCLNRARPGFIARCAHGDEPLLVGDVRRVGLPPQQVRNVGKAELQREPIWADTFRRLS
jgi:hypothetical protein